MKGKIDLHGDLLIERHGLMKEQFCHVSALDEEGGHFTCSDLCPLFGEPEYSNFWDNTKLKLCHKTLVFDEFKDERQ